MATMAFASSSAVACGVPGSVALARQFNTETLKATTNFRNVRSVRICVRAGINPGRIGSRRKKGGSSSPKRTEEVEAEEEDRSKEPFLQTYIRQYREEGHQVLDDGEMLLAKASNPYGLVLQIAEEANEYLRTRKEESITRKPVLKVISDKINEIYGDGVRDSYINEKEDYSEFEQ